MRETAVGILCVFGQHTVRVAELPHDVAAFEWMRYVRNAASLSVSDRISLWAMRMHCCAGGSGGSLRKWSRTAGASMKSM